MPEFTEEEAQQFLETVFPSLRALRTCDKRRVTVTAGGSLFATLDPEERLVAEYGAEELQAYLYACGLSQTQAQEVFARCFVETC